MSNTQFVDLYKILGIEFGASEEEIKKAYRRLAKELHPDTHIGEDISSAKEEKMRKEFTKVNEAYEILKNENTKKEYDVRYVAEQIRREEFKKQQEQKEAKRRAEEARRREEARAKEQASYNYGEAFVQQEEKNKQKEKNANERKEHSHKAKHRRKGFAEEVVEAYKEIRQEEKKNPYKKRHKKIDKLFEEEYYNASSLTDDIIIKLKKGIVHIGVEFFYQLHKLTYINKDTVTKYVIRNRKTFAAIILAGAIISSTSAKNTSDNDVIIPQDESITQVDDRDMDYSQDERETNQVPVEQMPEDITLTRMYTVEFGDCLSSIAFDSNSTVSELKRINDLTSDIIYEGSTLEVPYYISQDDISYYTEKVQVEDKSLLEIAQEYETDVATIIRLNSESIEKINEGKYIILSDTLIVPKYITRSEYSAIKESDSIVK